jgi:hypothetical protein
VSIAGKRISLAAAPSDLSPLYKRFCAQSEPHDLELSAEEISQIIVPWLATASPVCAWQWHEGQGFTCTLADANGEELSLASLKKILLAQWIRPPYLLLRRVSILAQLDELHNATASEQETLTAQFCRSLTHALRDEKPLIMNSPHWQRGFCAATSPEQRQQAYHIGSSYGLRELAFFQKLAQLTTHKGHLSIKLPADTFAGKELWVQLEARDDVNTTVWNSARELVGSGTKSSGALAVTWHPLFSHSPDDEALACDPC